MRWRRASPSRSTGRRHDPLHRRDRAARQAEYKVGEALDVAGLVVTATVADGNGGSTTRELAADEYELLGFDSSKAPTR